MGPAPQRTRETNDSRLIPPNRPGAVLLLLAFLVMTLSAAFASTTNQVAILAAGARFGVSFPTESKQFTQGEFYADVGLPWRWESDGALSLYLRPTLTASAGWLGDDYADGAVLKAGFGILFGSQRFPLSVEVGFSPTCLTEEVYGTKDFGTKLQFTSHVALNFDLAARLRLSYRFQHMSNGSLARPNPGLNLHMVGFGVLF